MITREDIAMYNPDAIMWDGFDEAIIGMTTNGHVVYDISKIHELLMANGEMTLDEAIDYAEYNILCAHVGEFTPVHMTTLK
jgi:hypothetical protein